MAKQKKHARRVAERQYQKSSKSASASRLQGFFSRTIFVTFTDKTRIVIQFRPEPLDITPFVIARGTLGEVVPEIGLIEDAELEKHNIWTYHMTMMAGKIWSEAVVGRAQMALETVNQSLGEVFANGFLQDRSDEAVDTRLRPHLELILNSDLAHVQPFKETVKSVLGKLDSLKSLPLWVTHFDLNDVNVMLDDDFKVSGLIDWELSFPQPFGLLLGRIHTLAGEYHDGKFYMSTAFEAAERSLWVALYAKLSEVIPGDIAQHIVDSPELVQLSVITGTILDTFQLDDGKLLENPGVAVEALPKLLSYRIPGIRGSEPPYLE